MNIIHFVSRITVQKERNVRQGFEAVNSHRPKGRPHKALVTREKIAQAALAIVGKRGMKNSQWRGSLAVSTWEPARCTTTFRGKMT